MGARRPLIASVIGTRPEAIKMAPLIRELSRQDDLDQQIILTGQHAGLADHFGSLPVRDLAIDPSHQSAGEIRESIHHALCGHFVRRPVDLVLVQGDTTSAFAGALAAKDCEIPVGHVEAGLRSGALQQPWPEEINRIAIDEVSALLFAPSEGAAGNLETEAVDGAIHITGNTGIDALFEVRDSLPGHPAPEDDARKTILVTCHRRESRGRTLEGIAAALKRIVRTLPVRIILPVHTNPHVRRAIERHLAHEPHISLIKPLGYEEMVALMLQSWLILSDSGGLQEEGPALGRPVLILRDVTERDEAISSGGAALVGTGPERIVAAVSALVTDEARYKRMATPSFPFGEGDAAVRIADVIADFLLESHRAAVR